MGQPMPPFPQSIFDRSVLFDTCALEAIFDSRDQYHLQAADCLKGLSGQPPNFFYVTILTIAETHRRLRYKSTIGYDQALRFLISMYDGSMNIIRPGEEDEREAMELIERYQDQDLSFTDVVNMAVMKRLGIRKAHLLQYL